MNVDKYFEDKEVPTDSLELMDLILDIEDDFDITISDKDYEDIETLEDLKALVKEKVDGKN